MDKCNKHDKTEKLLNLIQSLYKTYPQVFIEGKILIDNQILSSKDAMGISNLNEFEIEILEKAKILIIEIPTK